MAFRLWYVLNLSDETYETGRVVVTGGLGVTKGFQYRVGLHNLIFQSTLHAAETVGISDTSNVVHQSQPTKCHSKIMHVVELMTRNIPLVKISFNLTCHVDVRVSLIVDYCD